MSQAAQDPTEDEPGLRPARPVRRVLARTWHKTFDDRILGLAAEAGFWALVSLPSMLLAIFGAIGYLRGMIGAGAVNHIRDDVLRAARDVLTPGTVSSDVAPILDQVLARGHLEVMSIGFVISLWSGSTAMSDYLNTITVAYGMRGLRGAVRSRLVALWLYLCALVFGIVLLPALALGPDVITALFPGNVHDEVSVTVHVVYWPVVAVGTVALLALLYKACLPVRVSWRRGLPGATVAMVLWVVFSFVVRAWLTSSFRQHSAYGSLSAPIAGLLFFYFTALAVLLGAELNSAIDEVRPVRSTTDGRQRSIERAGTRHADVAAAPGRPVEPAGDPTVESPLLGGPAWGWSAATAATPPPGEWNDAIPPQEWHGGAAAGEWHGPPMAAPPPPAPSPARGPVEARRRSRWLPRTEAVAGRPRRERRS